MCGGMRKILVTLLLPSVLIATFISLWVFVSRASSFNHYQITDDPYPPPPTSTSGPYIPGSYHLFLPYIRKNWTYLSGINVPPYSMSNMLQFLARIMPIYIMLDASSDIKLKNSRVLKISLSS